MEGPGGNVVVVVCPGAVVVVLELDELVMVVVLELDELVTVIVVLELDELVTMVVLEELGVVEDVDDVGVIRPAMVIVPLVDFPLAVIVTKQVPFSPTRGKLALT